MNWENKYVYWKHGIDSHLKSPENAHFVLKSERGFRFRQNKGTNSIFLGIDLPDLINGNIVRFQDCGISFDINKFATIQRISLHSGGFDETFMGGFYTNPEIVVYTKTPNKPTLSNMVKYYRFNIPDYQVCRQTLLKIDLSFHSISEGYGEFTLFGASLVIERLNDGFGAPITTYDWGESYH